MAYLHNAEHTQSLLRPGLVVVPLGQGTVRHQVGHEEGGQHGGGQVQVCLIAPASKVVSRGVRNCRLVMKQVNTAPAACANTAHNAEITALCIVWLAADGLDWKPKAENTIFEEDKLMEKTSVIHSLPFTH